MKKKLKTILIVLPIASLVMVLFFTNSCSNELDILFPEWDDDAQTTPLNADQRSRMEGIYSVEQGSDQFGSTVILQWTTKEKNYLSIYTGKNFGYFLMQGGMLDTTVYVQGFWRYQNSAKTGLSQFKITSGAAYVLGTSPDSTTIVFTGTWGNGESTPQNSVVFRYVRPIKPELLQNDYWIMNHHGSGGGANYYPQTENTIEICKIIERYGANSIAIDISLSKDGIPYLFHDEALTPRVCQKGSLTGDPDSYTYKELYSFVRLINGERIPTLEATLDAIVTETTLEFVYIDCKGAYASTSALSTAASIVEAALDKAESMNNDVKIYLAITSDDVLNAFLQLPDYQDIPTICELTIDDLYTAGSEVWSPRWTEGTQNSDVESLHANGKQAICWTVDIPSFMQTYLYDGLFDGMMTNYANLLAYYYYGQ